MSIFAQQINWSFNTELYGRRGLFLRFALFRAKKLLILCNVDFINPPEATAGLTYRPRCKQDVLTNIKPDGVMNFLTEDCDILGFASQTWLGVLWLSSNSQSEFHLTLKGYEKRWGYFLHLEPNGDWRSRDICVDVIDLSIKYLIQHDGRVRRRRIQFTSTLKSPVDII